MRLYKCPICLFYIKRKDTIVLSCNCFACAECLAEWTLENIKEMLYELDDEIMCHSEDCYCDIKVQEIFEKLPLEYGDKINEELLNVYLNDENDVRKCPKFNCPYAGILPKSSCSDRFSCPLCETQWRDYDFSIKKSSRKPGLPQKYNKDEIFKYFKKFLFTKKCPKCFKNLQKEGDNSVNTCPCGYKFCVDCGSHFRNHNNLVHYSQTASSLFFGLMIVLSSTYLLYNLIPFLRFLANSILTFWVWTSEYGNIIKGFLIFNLCALGMNVCLNKELKILKRIGGFIFFFVSFGITFYLKLMGWAAIFAVVEVSLLLIACCFVEIIECLKILKKKFNSIKTNKQKKFL